jgi:hypothetical protein
MIPVYTTTINYPLILVQVFICIDKAYVGLSVPNFLETNRYDSNDVRIFKEKVNYYLIAGYILTSTII